MADIQSDQANHANKKKLMASLIDALKDNREALRFLPEVIEEFTERKQAEEEQKTEAHNLLQFR